MGGRCWLKSVLILCASGLSLWGTGPGGEEVEGGDGEHLDEEQLLQPYLLLLEETVESRASDAWFHLKGFADMTRISIAELMEDRRNAEEWESYLKYLDRMQAVCLKCAREIAALKNVALVTQNAAFHGISNEPTDPIITAWKNFSISTLRQNPQL
jgi:hypothetical protein